MQILVNLGYLDGGVSGSRLGILYTFRSGDSARCCNGAFFHFSVYGIPYIYVKRICFLERVMWVRVEGLGLGFEGSGPSV